MCHENEEYRLGLYLLGWEVAHLRPRTNLIGGAMRVRSALSYAVHKFFQERGFVYAGRVCTSL